MSAEQGPPRALESRRSWPPLLLVAARTPGVRWLVLRRSECGLLPTSGTLKFPGRMLGGGAWRDSRAEHLPSMRSPHSPHPAPSQGCAT